MLKTKQTEWNGKHRKIIFHGIYISIFAKDSLSLPRIISGKDLLACTFCYLFVTAYKKYRCYLLIFKRYKTLGLTGFDSELEWYVSMQCVGDWHFNPSYQAIIWQQYLSLIHI